MAWNAGYVTDINYTYGYYNELNPARVRSALLASRIRPPAIRNACELGFGQGLSAAIHAAAEPEVTWWGTDFNPAQAAFASGMASEAGVTAHFYDQAFAEFCARDDLPEFEFIALHGIWTWISDENRAVIVDFVRRKLAVGGVLYISYNTLPGWAQAAPLRHLMREHAKYMSAPGPGIVNQIEGALAFTEELVTAQANYVRTNPQVADRVQSMKKLSRNYLAHEYMNRDWRPMYFAEMAEALSDAKVSYAGSVNLIEHHDNVNLTAEQAAFFAGVPDPIFRETVRDYLTNQQFRRDLWVKGPRGLSALEQLELLRAERFVMTTPRDAAPMKVQAIQGEADLHEHIYKPLYDFLADHKPRAFAEIEQVALRNNINIPQLIAATQIMTAVGSVSPVQAEKVSAKAKPTVQAINRALIAQARTSGDIAHLASAQTGGGIAVSRFDQLFLLAAMSGLKTPQEWAQHAAGIMAVQGQKLIKEGVTLESAEDALAELVSQATSFNEKRLPILKALGIA